MDHEEDNILEKSSDVPNGDECQKREEEEEEEEEEDEIQISKSHHV